MLNQFSRTELMFGNEGMNRLQNARVAVFGIGGSRWLYRRSACKERVLVSLISLMMIRFALPL